MRILDPEDWIDSDEDQPRAPAARNNAAGRARAVPPSLSGHAATPSSTEAAFAGQLGPQTPSTDAKPRKRGGRTADRVFSEYYRYCYLSGNSVYNCSFCDHCFGVMRDADGTMKPSTKIVRHFREHHSKMLDVGLPFAVSPVLADRA